MVRFSINIHRSRAVDGTEEEKENLERYVRRNWE